MGSAKPSSPKTALLLPHRKPGSDCGRVGSRFSGENSTPPVKLKLGGMHWGVFLQEDDPNWALCFPAYQEGPY